MAWIVLKSCFRRRCTTAFQGTIKTVLALSTDTIGVFDKHVIRRHVK